MGQKEKTIMLYSRRQVLAKAAMSASRLRRAQGVPFRNGPLESIKTLLYGAPPLKLTPPLRRGDAKGPGRSTSPGPLAWRK